MGVQEGRPSRLVFPCRGCMMHHGLWQLPQILAEIRVCPSFPGKAPGPPLQRRIQGDFSFQGLGIGLEMSVISSDTCYDSCLQLYDEA